ncbi:hypothetical protein ASPBRDRAFT_48440 [Aspergillus brasiliensis CBS 101740]|uniref:Uncharacterized protein n=1 Tax=Aspergillus brasiliensis (strain CBS 101740 / IMI 381727 / IBT 21946) TaxID=767769 RepID=A0A1L9U5L3_ASPBC|nr:hypothetical protein ASPBRDRAFT_48440 [Aspergillus brasiliensis CBS 101740]
MTIPMYVQPRSQKRHHHHHHHHHHEGFRKIPEREWGISGWTSQGKPPPDTVSY